MVADFLSPLEFVTVAVTSASPVCPWAASVTRLATCLSFGSACCTFTTDSSLLVQVTPPAAQSSDTRAATSRVPSSSSCALSCDKATPVSAETCSTFTWACALTAGLSATDTVICASPSATPVSWPFSSTATTSGLLDAQVSFVCVESAGTTVACRLLTWPGASFTESADSVTPVAGTGFTTISTSLLMLLP